MVGRSRTIKCKVKSLKGTLHRVILIYKHYLASSASPLGPKISKWAQEEKIEDKCQSQQLSLKTRRFLQLIETVELTFCAFACYIIYPLLSFKKLWQGIWFILKAFGHLKFLESLNIKTTGNLEIVTVDSVSSGAEGGVSPAGVSPRVGPHSSENCG